MSDRKPSSTPPPGGGTRSGAGFELRLERGGAYVRLADQPIAQGIRLESLTLQIPDVKFPFDVGLGAGQFRHRLADLADLSVAIDPSAADAALAEAGLAAFGVEDVRVAAREGFLEIAGRISGGPPFTMKAGLLPAAEHGVRLVFHSPRILGPSPLPAAALPHYARAVLEAIGEERVPAEPLAPLLRHVLAGRGWKLPRASEARLARAEIAGGVAHLAWDRAASGPARASSDAELLAADEGARAFVAAEAHLARGEPDAAREAYLAAGPAASAHPFAAERLLSLLVLEDRFHEEALDLAAEWLARRPAFSPALATEAAVRLARGEEGRAARALAALAQGAAGRGEVFTALAAAEAAFQLAGAERADALAALEVALGVRRDHVPALRALRERARAGGDREGQLRANRRIVAYDPDPASKARAHAELGELLLQADPPGARLHLDQAIRLAPDDAGALGALAKACAAAGEPLRAVRALDRLRELHLARGEKGAAARSALEAGALWEAPLAHAENALLRYRDACELEPSPEAHARAARAAEAAGQWAEAADHHAAVLALLDVSAPGAAPLAVRTRVALADVAEKRLLDPGAAAAHLAAAGALTPDDAALHRRLAGLARGLGNTAVLADALERLARLEPEAGARAALLAEAGEAALSLGRPADAGRRFADALAASPACRPALLGLAGLSRQRGDAAAEGDALARLVPLARDAAEAAELQDRLAAACEGAGDLGGALAAAKAAAAAAPSPARLDAALRLARRAERPFDVAALLEQRARAAQSAGDPAAAAAALLERARLVGEEAPALALAALAEARSAAPGDPAVLRAQAELAERLGDPRLALGALRALLSGEAPEGGTPAAAGEPALEVRAARAALACGEAAAARDHAERALARGTAGAAEVLEEILEGSGDGAARAEIVSRLGRHLEAARLHEQQGDAPRACAALERAAEDPAHAREALERLSALRLAAGDAAGAAAALLALARATPGAEGAPLALRAHDLARDPAALALAMERSDLVAPSDPGAAARLALAVLERDASSAVALRALATSPRAEHVPAGDRAGVLLRFARGAAASPVEAAAAHRARARLLADGGDAKGALEGLREASALSPEDEAALELRAEAAARAGDPADAARALLARAALAVERGEPASAERLAEAGLAAVAAGVDGGEDALCRALHAGPERETSRAVLEALSTIARERGDSGAERDALARLVPFLPTGARPAALLRHASLALSAGDAAASRASAEEARSLSPRDPGAVEACRVAALTAGDLARVADLLGELAALEPGSAAARHLDRARLLASLARPEEADAAYVAALAASPPDRALADEHARHRREKLAGRAAAEPLEELARRTEDGRAAGRALRAAAAIAYAGGDGATALRCARRAFARTQDDLAFAGPLLARLLYLAGGRAEALVLHRRLLDSGSPGIAPDESVALCRQAAELADDSGEIDLALQAYDRLLALRPQELEAALRRFELDPDRARAVRDLAEAADACRSRRRRALALARAAEAGLRIAADAAGTEGADRLFRRAMEDAAAEPALAAAIARRRSAAHRAAGGSGSAGHLAALRHEVAAAGAQAGAGASRALSALEELVAAERERGLLADAARDLLQLDALAVAGGDLGGSTLRLRGAGALLRQVGDLGGAAEALRRAWRQSPESAGTAGQLEEVARAMGAPGAPLLVEVLSDRAARAASGAHRAEALVALADAHPHSREREAALRAALEEAPGHAGAEDRLLSALAEAGRGPERARILLDRAERARDEEDRGELRRTAAGLLAASPDAADRSLAAETWGAVAALDPRDAAAARTAARLLAELGRREEAIPHLAALVRADPDDEAAARELAEAYGDRHLERAELFRARAEHAAGEVRASRLTEAARAFFAAGAEERARATLREAFEAWPAAGPAFAEALRAAASDVDRTDAVLLARAAAVPAEAAACHRARADALQAFGATERAIGAYEAALAADPRDVQALASLATCVAAAHGEVAASEHDVRVVLEWEDAPAAVPAAAEAPSRYRLGLALVREERLAQAVPHLERAVVLAPGDPRAAEAWSALVRGHAVRGESASALAAARARVNRAVALGPESELLAAVAAERGIAAELGVRVPALPAGAARVIALDELDESGPAAGGAADGDGVAPRSDLEVDLHVDLDPDVGPDLARGPDLAHDLARDPDPDPDLDHDPDPDPDPDLAPTPDLDLQPAAEPEPPAAAAVPAEPEPATEEAPDRAAAAFIASAEALARAGAPSSEIRAAIERACDADSDSPEPWRARARVEDALGDALAAARAHLAVSIRTEGDEAAGAALEAAARFEALERHSDAARAYRAALHARPGSVPACALLAEEALAAGDFASAAGLLLGIDAAALPAEAAARHARKLARAREAAGRAEAQIAFRDEPGVDDVELAFREDPGLTAPPLAGAPPDLAGAAFPDPDAEDGARAAQEIRLDDVLVGPEPTPDAPDEPPELDLLELAAAAQQPGPEIPELPDLAGITTEAPAAAEPPAAEEAFSFGEAGSEPAGPADGGGTEPEAPIGRAPEALARDGRARMEEGDLEAAFGLLSLALAREPSDLTIARDLSRVAERLGRDEEYVQLGEVCADAVAAYDPLAAAARFRQLAGVLREKLANPVRAAVMLEKALALVPDDADTRRELNHVWGSHAETAPRALASWLELARRDPADAGALGGIARVCATLAASPDSVGAARAAEQGRLAASLAAFVSPAAHLPPAPVAAAPLVPEDLRARIAVPGAAGPLAALLRVLTPWLEPLFPADLRRRGAAPGDLLDPARAPVLASAFEAAARALSARPHAVFLAARDGFELALENTQPPAVVASSPLAELPGPALAFLAARALELLDRGWALAGKFAPKDVGILLELACRFAGGAPPSLGLPQERAGAFLAVLEAQVPPPTRAAAAELGRAACEELASTDPRAFAAALRRTANRVALLHSGEPGPALHALALLDRRPGANDPVQALALPDHRDLALFALSEPFLELRAMVVG